MLLWIVLLCLGDPEFLVHIEASKVLCVLIELEGEEVNLLPFLPHILHGYFRMMTYIGTTRSWALEISSGNHYDNGGDCRLHWPHLQHGCQDC